MSELRDAGRRVNIDSFCLRGLELRKLTGTCACGAKLRGRSAIPVADPYASEINGDETLHVMCADCRHKSNQEI